MGKGYSMGLNTTKVGEGAPQNPPQVLKHSVAHYADEARRKFSPDVYSGLMRGVSLALLCGLLLCFALLRMEGDPDKDPYPYGLPQLHWADKPNDFPYLYIAVAPFTIIVTSSVWLLLAEDYQQKCINLAAGTIFLVSFAHYIFMDKETGRATSWNGRHFTPFRYVEWCIGLPMMKYLSILQKEPNVERYLELALVDISMVVTGVMAELYPPGLIFGVFITISLLLYVRGLQLFFTLIDSLPHDPIMKKVFLVSYILGSGLFPVAWLSSYFGIISEFTECAVYVLGDLTSKIALNSAFRVGHTNQTLRELSAKHRAELIARTKIERDAKQRREFMNYIFHEVRVPINGLSMGVDMLKLILNRGDYDNIKDRREEQDSIQVIDDGLVHVTKVLNDILNLEKTDQGKLQLEESPFVLHASLKRVLGVYKASALQRKIQLSLPMEKLPMVVGDKYRLKQIVSNFVSNALKFTPPGGKIKLKVAVMPNSADIPVTFPPIYENKEETEVILNKEIASGERRWIRISVADSGIGLSEEAQRNLFQAYTQINPGKNQAGGGTGLGLAICQKFVEFMHGHIGVTSAQGKGSEFYIILPYKVKKAAIHVSDYGDSEKKKRKQKVGGDPSHQQYVPATSEVDHSPSDISEPNSSDYERAAAMPLLPLPDPEDVAGGQTTGSGNKRKRSTFVRKEGDRPQSILVVDDHLNNRKLLARILQTHGFRVETANNGKECVNKVFSGAVFDYIVMDQEMPEMTGPEAARALRSAGWSNPIIGVTGNWLEEKQSEMYAAGFDWVMLKPFNLRAFLDYIGERQHKVQKATHKPIFITSEGTAEADVPYQPPPTIVTGGAAGGQSARKRSRFGPSFRDLLESSEGSSCSDAGTPDARPRRLARRMAPALPQDLAEKVAEKKAKLKNTSTFD
eukprot:gb/GEZN01001058.1/.p1 GENE.gb/GEZN01001058.1/~~gb/GEZN01001058.1/.p1  ORF type:complete len:922 (+),score=179.51 gb/GEZN01001058.1/:33-2768(+)